MQIINKPILLHSRELKDSKNFKLCEECGGIGWMADDYYTHIEHCRKCCGTGIIKICQYCGKETSFCDCEESKNERHHNHIHCDDHYYKTAIIHSSDSEFAKNMPMFYSPYYPYNEGFFVEWEDLFDWYYNGLYDNLSVEKEKPEYVFATIPIQTYIDANDVLDRISEDFNTCENVEIKDHISTKTFNRLKYAMEDLRNEVNNNCLYYEQDVNNIIKIPWEK